MITYLNTFKLSIDNDRRMTIQTPKSDLDHDLAKYKNIQDRNAMVISQGDAIGVEELKDGEVQQLTLSAPDGWTWSSFILFRNLEFGAINTSFALIDEKTLPGARIYETEKLGGELEGDSKFVLQSMDTENSGGDLIIWNYNSIKVKRADVVLGMRITLREDATGILWTSQDPQVIDRKW